MRENPVEGNFNPVDKFVADFETAVEKVAAGQAVFGNIIDRGNPDFRPFAKVISRTEQRDPMPRLIGAMATTVAGEAAVVGVFRQGKYPLDVPGNGSVFVELEQSVPKIDGSGLRVYTGRIIRPTPEEVHDFHSYLRYTAFGEESVLEAHSEDYELGDDRDARWVRWAQLCNVRFQGEITWEREGQAKKGMPVVYAWDPDTQKQVKIILPPDTREGTGRAVKVSVSEVLTIGKLRDVAIGDVVKPRQKKRKRGRR